METICNPGRVGLMVTDLVPIDRCPPGTGLRHRPSAHLTAPHDHAPTRGFA